MIKLLRPIIAAAAISALAIPAITATPASASCSRVRVEGTHLVFRWHVVRVVVHVREHGKVVKKVEHRREHVWRREVRRVHGKLEVRLVPTKVRVRYFRPVESCTATLAATAATLTAPAVTTATPTTTAPVSVRATIDPSWTLVPTVPQAPPVAVTFTYSASDAGQTGTLPAGTLTLNIYQHGSVAQSGGCAANVGGSVTSATCTVNIPSWGGYDLVVNYSGGSNVVATEGTETVDIEPPALPAVTNADAWPAPTGSLTITSPTSATASVTSPNFEGAPDVTLTDQLGDECSATVSGTTASCVLALTGAPSGLSVGYPGGTPTTTTEFSSAWGVSEPQAVTTTWPAETLQLAPAITKASQSVDFTSSAPTPAVGDSYSPTATATAGTVAFAGSGSCSGTGLITMDSQGTCTVTASQVGNGIYAPASTTQSFYVHTATNVVDSISQIDAYYFTAPSPNTGGYEYALVGVQGLPAQGTVTITDPNASSSISTSRSSATGESCTIDLTTSTTCYLMEENLTSSIVSAGQWQLTASWSGYSTADPNGNVVAYSAPTVSYTMGNAASGYWYNAVGS